MIKPKTLMQVTICGGGNLAHFSAAVIGSNPNMIVNVFTRRPKEWSKQIIGTPIQGNSWTSRGIFTGKLNIVSDNPQEVCKGTSVFIVCGPAQAHQPILEKIAPFVEPNSFVGTCYGQGGFDFACRFVFKEQLKSKNITIFGLQYVPSISQISKYGQSVRIIGPKSVLYATALPNSKIPEVCGIMENLYTIVTISVPNFLNLTLTPSNQIIHPARVYGLFKGWDGVQAFNPNEIPLLYEDMDDFSADLLQLLDDEIQSIKRALLAKFPSLNLSFVYPMAKRIVDTYGSQVKDTSSLKQIFRTNVGYSTVKVPVVQVEGGVVLNTKARFFTEDVPFGLVILKDIAQMLSLNTPGFDKMIEFHQQFMDGKQYIINGRLNKELLSETGAPSRFGIHDVNELVQPYLQNESAKL